MSLFGAALPWFVLISLARSWFRIRKIDLRLLVWLFRAQAVDATAQDIANYSSEGSQNLASASLLYVQLVLCAGALYIIAKAIGNAYSEYMEQMTAEEMANAKSNPEVGKTKANFSITPKRQAQYERAAVRKHKASQAFLGAFLYNAQLLLNSYYPYWRRGIKDRIAALRSLPSTLWTICLDIGASWSTKFTYKVSVVYNHAGHHLHNFYWYLLDLIDLLVWNWEIITRRGEYAWILLRKLNRRTYFKLI
jgi:hypothetical protein